MPERVLTLHPGGKRGVRIARDKYDDMRRALLRVIPRRKDGVPFGALAERVAPELSPGLWEGASITWYVVTVKQDLEARGSVEQVPGARPQHVRRTSSAYQ